ncbi:MAG: hypothetical protein ACHQ1H_01275 [Nitrososphaerales archaeon]
MDTREILIEAGRRAEQMSLQEGGDDFVSSLGLEDRDTVQEFCEAQSFEIMTLTSTMSRRGIMIDVVDSMSVAMLFGISIGYQLALLREESVE